jgi:hypothetical protein
LDTIWRPIRLPSQFLIGLSFFSVETATFYAYLARSQSCKVIFIWSQGRVGGKRRVPPQRASSEFRAESELAWQGLISQRAHLLETIDRGVHGR